MNPDLQKLVQLQATEDHIKQIEGALQEVPRLQAEIDADLARESAQLAAAREQMAEGQKRRRQNETALQDLEVRRSKYKGQLMEVKTNKEYQAMLHEIEAVEREIRAIEDRILDEMESSEALGATIVEEETRVKEAEARHRETTRELEARQGKLEAEREQAMGERDAVASTLAPEWLELFRRVARLRGTGVAEARDGMCQQCRMALRPQMYVDLRHNDQVTQCPSCSRVLYYAAPVPVVEAPQA